MCVLCCMHVNLSLCKRTYVYTNAMCMCVSTILIHPNILYTERDLVVGLLPIVLNENRAPHLEHFIAFLQQCKHSHITLGKVYGVWCMMYGVWYMVCG
ncbi:hypothetical protein EON63_02055 [archaeon]|nr:MAG: hypothetical protein EON63_02055 [archaeon]